VTPDASWPIFASSVAMVGGGYGAIYKSAISLRNDGTFRFRDEVRHLAFFIIAEGIRNQPGMTDPRTPA
jgi:hypothetical protein